jgi:predicted O-linked N-acetylglucosamine transferase (SPINDLY family)
MGPKFIQRSSASILIHSGLDFLVAKTDEEYVDIARSLACQILCGNGPNKLRIQSKFLEGPVLNGTKFMRAYETMLVDIVSKKI